MRTRALALARTEMNTEQMKSISSVEKPAVTTPMGQLKCSKYGFSSSDLKLLLKRVIFAKMFKIIIFIALDIKLIDTH